MGYIKKRIRSFGFAFEGLWNSFKSEAHLQILLLSTILVIAAGFYFDVSKMEWIILILCCGIVMSLELTNSSIERLCDAFTTEIDPKIKYVKDVMAGAVVWASIMAAVIGVIIFYPYVISLF